ncbi:hypothetical protein ACFLZI_01550 [Nitrospirota bacterium]
MKYFIVFFIIFFPLNSYASLNGDIREEAVKQFKTDYQCDSSVKAKNQRKMRYSVKINGCGTETVYACDGYKGDIRCVESIYTPGGKERARLRQMEILKSKASFVFDCPVDKITISEISETSKGVKGCGKKAIYTKDLLTQAFKLEGNISESSGQ